MRGRLARIAVRLGSSLLLMFAGVAAHAAGAPAKPCDASTVDAILQRAYPRHAAPDHIDRRRVVCAARPAQTWLAVPLMAQALNAPDEGFRNGDLELLVADPTSHRLIARLRLKNRMDEDAIEVERLSFERKAYDLAAGTRAVGLRIERANRSRISPLGETTLSLVVLDGDRLKLVLDGLVVAQHNGEIDGPCKARFTNIERRPALSSSRFHGMANLDIAEITTIRYRSQGPGGACRELRSERSTRRRTMVYDGRRYPVPVNWQPLK
ncbi:hypothetical protein [Oleiagrimonas sp. MCCC 1A03011]|uniref:hypothetical protein n=1 Tax=Oleiagrimonas sp. MCCC 1A03011 TaxID=1926883 RepID=UPI000DC2D039|nr:hypothetical protein [Oleiagrimonas sp. MCCC 1A03011]RAP59196.1 hypothetical protein BTJ49_00445 [Oleiagrimonas sp. MCCC 1A03011]